MSASERERVEVEEDEGRGPVIVGRLRHAYLTGTLGRVCSAILADGAGHCDDALLALIGRHAGGGRLRLVGRDYPANRNTPSPRRDLLAHLRAEHPECPLPKDSTLAPLVRWHDWTHREDAS